MVDEVGAEYDILGSNQIYTTKLRRHAATGILRGSVLIPILLILMVVKPGQPRARATQCSVHVLPCSSNFYIYLTLAAS